MRVIVFQPDKFWTIADAGMLFGPPFSVCEAAFRKIILGPVTLWWRRASNLVSRDLSRISGLQSRDTRFQLAGFKGAPVGLDQCHDMRPL